MGCCAAQGEHLTPSLKEEHRQRKRPSSLHAPARLQADPLPDAVGRMRPRAQAGPRCDADTCLRFVHADQSQRVARRSVGGIGLRQQRQVAGAAGARAHAAKTSQPATARPTQRTRATPARRPGPALAPRRWRTRQCAMRGECAGGAMRQGAGRGGQLAARGKAQGVAAGAAAQPVHPRTAHQASRRMVSEGSDHELATNSNTATAPTVAGRQH